MRAEALLEKAKWILQKRAGLTEERQAELAGRERTCDRF
jgi:hypothetical protein